jgi:hypothetical protein
VAAPSEVRERVRQVAASDTTPAPRRLTWRRALVVAVPLAAAIAATIMFTRPAPHEATGTVVRGEPARVFTRTLATQKSLGHIPDLAAPSARSRVQTYGAALALRIPTSAGVSNALKRALRITASLGGYATSVHAQTSRHGATADLTLKIPRAHVQEALARLSQLGTITSEQVDIADKQAGLNATDALIAKLQKQLAALRALPVTPENTARISALTARIASLQRGEAATRRTAHYATIRLALATPGAAAPVKHGHGPLHGVGVALRWLGIGAVYALAIGAPVALLLALGWLAVRFVRRRREEQLLSSS